MIFRCFLGFECLKVVAKPGRVRWKVAKSIIWVHKSFTRGPLDFCRRTSFFSSRLKFFIIFSPKSPAFGWFLDFFEMLLWGRKNIIFVKTFFYLNFMIPTSAFLIFWVLLCTFLILRWLMKSKNTAKCHEKTWFFRFSKFGPQKFSR